VNNWIGGRCIQAGGGEKTKMIGMVIFPTVSLRLRNDRRKSRRTIDLRRGRLGRRQAQTPHSPPERERMIVISTPGFFHPSSPHMSLFPLPHSTSAFSERRNNPVSQKA
jgi:hypothetical protein